MGVGRGEGENSDPCPSLTMASFGRMSTEPAEDTSTPLSFRNALVAAPASPSPTPSARPPPPAAAPPLAPLALAPTSTVCEETRPQLPPPAAPHSSPQPHHLPAPQFHTPTPYRDRALYARANAGLRTTDALKLSPLPRVPRLLLHLRSNLLVVMSYSSTCGVVEREEGVRSGRAIACRVGAYHFDPVGVGCVDAEPPRYGHGGRYTCITRRVLHRGVGR
jgi:hypothetical protein